jgi:hypothetical protein
MRNPILVRGSWCILFRKLEASGAMNAQRFSFERKAIGRCRSYRILLKLSVRRGRCFEPMSAGFGVSSRSSDRLLITYQLVIDIS